MANTAKKEDLALMIDYSLFDLFANAHRRYETKSGDITPVQDERLRKIKSDLADLMVEQINQNF